MNETSGAIAHDRSGNGFDVTYSAGTKFLGVTGLIPTSSDLAVTNINADLKSAASVVPITMQSVSFAGWFRTTSSAALIGIVTVGAPGVFWGALYLNAGVLTLQLDDAVPAAHTTVGVGDLRDGGRHFVVGTYDGATLKVYQEGVQVGAGTAAAFALVNGSYSFGIGSQCPGVVVSQIGGTLDEVAIYDRALTAGEVADLYALATTTV